MTWLNWSWFIILCGKYGYTDTTSPWPISVLRVLHFICFIPLTILSFIKQTCITFSLSLKLACALECRSTISASDCCMTHRLLVVSSSYLQGWSGEYLTFIFSHVLAQCLVQVLVFSCWIEEFVDVEMMGLLKVIAFFVLLQVQVDSYSICPCWVLNGFHIGVLLLIFCIPEFN